MPLSIQRTLDVRVQFMWDDTNWTDETENFISATGAAEFLPPHEAYQRNRQLVQQMRVTLANPGLVYSPHQPGSRLYSYRDDGGAYLKPCRLQVSEDGANWANLFIGYIKIPTEVITSNQVIFTVWDKGETLRREVSSPLYRNALEHEVVINFLELAGMVDGTDFISPDYAETYSLEPTIDYSPIPLRYAWLDDEEIWREIGDIAQATGSTVYVGPDNMIYYRRGWRWGFSNNIEALTLSDYSEITPRYDDRAFYDKVVVDYSTRFVGPSDSDLWELSRPKIIGPGETEEITARFEGPILSTQTPVQDEDYRISFFNHTPAYDAVTIHQTEYNGQQATIKITNNDPAKPVVLMDYKLKGQSVMGEPSEQYEAEIDTPRHDRKLSVRGNPYIAHEYQAKTIADFLVWWYSKPRPTYTIGGLQGKVSRRLGDTLQFELGDSTTTGVLTKLEFSVRLLPTTRAFSFSQTATVLESSTLAADDYFILGTDKYSLGTTQKKVWI